MAAKLLALCPFAVVFIAAMPARAQESRDWERGKLDCGTVSPDAAILGLRSARWNPAEQVLYASTTFPDLVNADGADETIMRSRFL